MRDADPVPLRLPLCAQPLSAGQAAAELTRS